MIFELDSVELYFKKKRILSGIYLKGETGKVTGILGSNGCGKSCLLHIAFGSLKPKYKLIKVDNTPILKPLYITKKVAILSQLNFTPNQMKIKNVFSCFKLNWKDFKNTFEGIHISKEMRLNRFSGGERRLIETYIILKSKASIIFLDEPFAHIAPLHIEIIKDIISEEKQQKVIIITDHLYQHIIDVSDTIYLLKNGCTKLIDKLTELEDYKYISALK